MDTVIAVESLTKPFGQTLAVDDLSFEVSKGSIVGFLGPNGAGKSTTLRMLLGLTAPTSGRAIVEGRSYAELHDPASVVGAVLDSTSFHSGRTGRNHLRVLAKAADVPPSRVDDLLRLVELDHAGHRRVKEY